MEAYGGIFRPLRGIDDTRSVGYARLALAECRYMRDAPGPGLRRAGALPIRQKRPLSRGAATGDAPGSGPPAHVEHVPAVGRHVVISHCFPDAPSLAPAERPAYNSCREHLSALAQDEASNADFHRRRTENVMSISPKSRLRDASREAPGPWRVGERDHKGIQVVDANGDSIATISTAPHRSESTLETIEALIVGVGSKMIGQRICANPACGRLIDAPSRKQKHCSTRCSLATQPRIIQARERAKRAYELRCQGFTYRTVAERCGYSSAHRARSCVLTHAYRNRLPVPSPARPSTAP